MGLGLSTVIFGGAALLMWISTRIAIPFSHRITDVEPVLLWFVVSGLGVFTPLLFLSFWLLHREGALSQPSLWRERLRFHRMNGRDWLWALGALVSIGIMSAGLMYAIEMFTGRMDHQPPFMAFEPLTPGRYWLLTVWFPFWLLNIMGEEILWRGVILPQQEGAFRRSAWLANGTGWLLFHLAFGWQLLITLLPILFILPYVTQRRRNSWVAVVVHAGLNGPSFLAIAFGLL